MNEPDSHWRGASPAGLEWLSDDLPRSTTFDDVYFSAESGLAESAYVFLHGNDLPKRWQHEPTFTIAETGFGTGLNFLTCWQHWREQPGDCRRLHFISTELYPLRRQDSYRALSRWKSLAPLREQLLEAWPAPLPGRHRLVFEGGQLVLDLNISDAADAFDDMASQSHRPIDAWFLDGFSPARNAALWNEGLYATMAQLSAVGSTVATFSAAGQVRRELEAAGFAMRKRKGFGSKRDMLQGVYQGPTPSRAARRTPWHIGRSVQHQRRALVIGAGLAGTSVAAALASRGWQVQVVEAEALARGASGNDQGVLFTRVSHQSSAMNSFSLLSYAYAVHCYRQLMAAGELREETEIQLCGALHLQPAITNQRLRETVESMAGLVRYVDKHEARQISGVECSDGGMYFPDAGWLEPAAVCRAHCNHSGITLLEASGPVDLRRDNGAWVAQSPSGREFARAPIAIVAAGTGSTGFTGLDWLPLRSIRGQVTQLPSQNALEKLRCVVCHAGYVAPARNGEHCIGATFDIDDDDPHPRITDHQQNLDHLHAALPALDLTLSAPKLDGWVGFRCASPDYLPLCGPAPDRAAFMEEYSGLRKNARRVIPGAAPYQPGLYISTGHGSRGLTSTPLSAELLAAQICSEFQPVEEQLCRALSPARFIIRDLARNMP